MSVMRQLVCTWFARHVNSLLFGWAQRSMKRVVWVAGWPERSIPILTWRCKQIHRLAPTAMSIFYLGTLLQEVMWWRWTRVMNLQRRRPSVPFARRYVLLSYPHCDHKTVHYYFPQSFLMPLCRRYIDIPFATLDMFTTYMNKQSKCGELCCAAHYYVHNVSAEFRTLLNYLNDS